jgi:hypothetical protein
LDSKRPFDLFETSTKGWSSDISCFIKFEEIQIDLVY